MTLVSAIRRMPALKPVGKPDAGNPHVRFDERGEETGRLQSLKPPRPSSTLLPARPCRRQVLAEHAMLAKMTVANAGSPRKARISRKPSCREGRLSPPVPV